MLNRVVCCILPLIFLSRIVHSASAVTPVAINNPAPLQKRWLFVWRNLKEPGEVDRMIARFPQAASAGYNGIVFPHDVTPDKCAELKKAAERYRLDLIAIVMGGASDRNYVEGVPVTNALFIARAGKAVFQPDNPTRLVNGDFERATGNHFDGWTMQDDEGVTTFSDHGVAHSGKASLRMQDIGKNESRHCRLAQLLRLQPYRQYAISFSVKTEALSPADAEVKLLTADASRGISFQTFHVEPTQDWKQYYLAFNSLEYQEGRLYLGSWSGQAGKIWWDDVRVMEMGPVNVLRRPGCPVIVRGDDGTTYEEGRDYDRIEDPQLNPWNAFHEAPAIQLASHGRIQEGTRLRLSYYHPLVVYQDRVTSCLSEPKIFETWQTEIRHVEALLHPAGFLMSHDELRVMNQCASCRGKRMTPGELLAWNVRKAAQIIHEIRPEAEIWVWSDMFDPMHNAVDHYYAVNGSLAGSWKGLDKDIGIVNWYGELKGKNCRFFAELGSRQILSGYYDHDEDGKEIAAWLENTKGIPGIAGAMYTTWEDKYGALKPWADQVWGIKKRE